VPDQFSVLVFACQSRSGRSGFITNRTKGVIAIHPRPSSAEVKWVEPAQTSLNYQMTQAATKLGMDGVGGYRLGPKATVVASADATGGPDLWLEIDNSASVVSFATNYLADFLAGLSKSPSQRFVASGISCAKAVGGTMSGLTGNRADLINHILDLTACVSVYDALKERQPPRDTRGDLGRPHQVRTGLRACVGGFVHVRREGDQYWEIEPS
jgi:hypothetical protein